MEQRGVPPDATPLRCVADYEPRRGLSGFGKKRKAVSKPRGQQ
jgi:hypothetical protein